MAKGSTKGRERQLHFRVVYQGCFLGFSKTSGRGLSCSLRGELAEKAGSGGSVAALSPSGSGCCDASRSRISSSSLKISTAQMRQRGPRVFDQARARPKRLFSATANGETRGTSGLFSRPRRLDRNSFTYLLPVRAPVRSRLHHEMP